LIVCLSSLKPCPEFQAVFKNPASPNSFTPHHIAQRACLWVITSSHPAHSFLRNSCPRWTIFMYRTGPNQIQLKTSSRPKVSCLCSIPSFPLSAVFSESYMPISVSLKSISTLNSMLFGRSTSHSAAKSHSPSKSKSFFRVTTH